MTINKLSEYGHAFQIKVLASLLTDNKFLQSISDIINIDHFESEAHKWIISYIQKYNAKYKTYPTMDVLAVEVKKEKKESLRVSITENLREVYCSTPEDVEYVQEEFFNFCKNQCIKSALLQSVDLLNDGNYPDIDRIMRNALNIDQNRDMGHDYNKDIDARFVDDAAKVLDFPWKSMNDNTDGGLEPGNLMLIFAPPGIGKTTLLANIIAHNLKKGKNILCYPLEITAKKMGQKIDSILTGIPIKELKKHRKKVEEVVASLPGKLIIKDYPPRKASLDTLRAHQRKLRLNEGFVPDGIAIDYPELLKVLKSRREQHEEVHDVYTEIKGDAMEDLIPRICPSQINRSGARDRIIEGDKVAGSFGKMMIGDLNIAMSRIREDKKNGVGMIHYIKSRLGPDGIAYRAKMDLERGYIDIEDEEWDEDESKSSNGTFDNEDMKELQSKFAKFTKQDPDDLAA